MRKVVRHYTVESDELIVIVAVVQRDEVDGIFEQRKDLILLKLRVILDKQKVEFESEGGVGGHLLD